MRWIEPAPRRSRALLRELPERPFDSPSGSADARRAGVPHGPVERGCPVCRAVDSAGRFWHARYVAEAHDDPRSRRGIAVAGGLCAAHLRALCADPQARPVLPQMFADIIAFQLAGPETSAPAPECEACVTTIAAEQKAIGDIVVRLDDPDMSDAIHDGDYCLGHLFRLMDAAPPRWNARVGAMTRRRLLDTDSGGDLIALLISFDSGRSRTAPLWVLVDDLRSEQDAHGGFASAEDRVVADLGRDCCPVCRAAAHAELRYVHRLLAQDRSRLGSVEFWLCSTHLAAATLFGYAAARQIAESMRDHVLAGLSEPRGGFDGSGEAIDMFRDGAPVCAACAAGSLATDGAVSLLLAALDIPRIRELWGRSHGPCLRHIGLFGSDRLPRQVLHDRLEPLLWELLRNPSVVSSRPNGSDVVPWQRAVSFVCGEAFLGCTAREYQQYAYR